MKTFTTLVLFGAMLLVTSCGEDAQKDPVNNEPEVTLEAANDTIDQIESSLNEVEEKSKKLEETLNELRNYEGE